MRMNRIAVGGAFVGVLLALSHVSASSVGIIWSGLDLTFTKQNNADWTLAQNQDRITDNVWLTRQNAAGLFNIAQESAFAVGSPTDTEWAFSGLVGNPVFAPGEGAAGHETLVFSRWEGALQSNPFSLIVDRPAVVHLISDDIYVDIRFTSWTAGPRGGGPGGGGFSYQRAVPEPSVLVLLAIGGLLAHVLFVRRGRFCSSGNE